MELSKVLDGFIDADTLIIKAQVQVIRFDTEHSSFLQPFLIICLLHCIVCIVKYYIYHMLQNLILNSIKNQCYQIFFLDALCNGNMFSNHRYSSHFYPVLICLFHSFLTFPSTVLLGTLLSDSNQYHNLSLLMLLLQCGTEL